MQTVRVTDELYQALKQDAYSDGRSIVKQLERILRRQYMPKQGSNQ